MPVARSAAALALLLAVAAAPADALVRSRAVPAEDPGLLVLRARVAAVLDESARRLAPEDVVGASLALHAATTREHLLLVHEELLERAARRLPAGTEPATDVDAGGGLVLSRPDLGDEVAPTTHASGSSLGLRLSRGVWMPSTDGAD